MTSTAMSWPPISRVAAAPDRGQDSGRHAEDDGEQDGDDRQLKCRREQGHELGEDGLLGDQRGAEITRQRVADELEVLLPERPVEAELMHQLGMALGRDGSFPGHDDDRVAGAEAAVERGHIAGLAAVCALQPGRVDRERDIPSRRALARYEGARAFLDWLYRPAAPFRMPSGDTIVCRCEEVTAQQIVDAVRIGCTGPNQMKAFLRCGMGPCQGRMCGLTVTELIASARGVTPAEVGYYRIRPPVKPLALAELAGLPKPDAAMDAVGSRRT